jgi:phenylacetate-CoA ligase
VPQGLRSPRLDRDGFGGGVECAAGGGYHLREADLLFEIVSPDTWLAVADGESDEIVPTSLTRTGMPLVRYRTGDVSRFLPEAWPCSTGMLKRTITDSRSTEEAHA